MRSGNNKNPFMFFVDSAVEFLLFTDVPVDCGILVDDITRRPFRSAEIVRAPIASSGYTCIEHTSP